MGSSTVGVQHGSNDRPHVSHTPSTQLLPELQLGSPPLSSRQQGRPWNPHWGSKPHTPSSQAAPNWHRLFSQQLSPPRPHGIQVPSLQMASCMQRSPGQHWSPNKPQLSPAGSAPLQIPSSPHSAPLPRHCSPGNGLSLAIGQQSCPSRPQARHVAVSSKQAVEAPHLGSKDVA